MGIVDEEKLADAVRENRPIKVRLYALLPDTENELSRIIESILEKHDRPDYLSAVYTATKELALNGAKANIKRILFEEENVDVEDQVAYEQAMRLFKERLTDEFTREYARKAYERNLFVDVRFDYDETHLVIQVLNNSAMSEKEDSRVREKFRLGEKYDSIAEYYMDVQDNVEGAGMGIALILMLLKAQEIDTHLFTIQSDFRTKTVARVEFPFIAEHVSARDAYVASEQV